MTAQIVMHKDVVQLDPHSRQLLPRMPQSIEDTGLDFSFLVSLITKIMFLGGQINLLDLADRSKLPFVVLEPVLSFMRAERLCEILRRSEAEISIVYALTDTGRQRAQEFMLRSQYAGPAPVSLQAYVEQTERQSIKDMRVTADKVGKAFNGLVVRERVLNQFGAAMNSGRAIFVYGPAGSGKTFIAERLVGLLSGNVAIPYAVEVDNEVIQLFDPMVHEPLKVEKNTGRELDLGKGYDTRWVPCRRPVVLTGGELTLGMLDLEFDRRSAFYQAPPQVKANNGLFIIDDLGRQLVSPQDLMNRWIVPLDRHIDYLALHTGKKFMVPFDVIVVFSSNLQPSKLADEAFMRRLGYKIYVGQLDEAEYRAIFKQVCDEMNIPFNETGLNYLLHEHHYKEKKPLYACIPRDILGQLRDSASYHEMKPELTEHLLDWAWENYYTRE